MGKEYTEIDDRIQRWMDHQKYFAFTVMAKSLNRSSLDGLTGLDIDKIP
jgi:hypothetical protein